MLDLLFTAYVTFAMGGEQTAYTGVEVPSLVLTPVQTGAVEAPLIWAQSALVYDQSSATILYEKDADKPLPIASLTKIMTALLANEILSQNQEIKIPEAAAAADVRQTKVFGLPVGKIFRAKDLLASMLVGSGADSAVSLAVASSGSEGDFIREMNDYAKELGLKNTAFADSFGLSVGDISTARELTWLWGYLWQRSDLREMVGLDEIEVCDESADCYKVASTNVMAESQEFTVLGAKTGTTDQAGQCLVLTVRSPKGNIVVVTILNSTDRWTDARALLRWVFNNFTV